MLLDQLPPITSDRFWDAPLKVVLGGLFLALVAPIELPFSIGSLEIPITLQSLVVVMLACLLGAWRSSFAVLCYLLLGVMGLPVYAEGKAGLAHLLGPTAGFLFGFVVVAWVAGRLAEQQGSERWWALGLIFLGSHLLLLIPGSLWLGLSTSWDRLAAIPSLLPGLILKSLIGMLLMLGINGGLRVMLNRKTQHHPEDPSDSM